MTAVVVILVVVLVLAVGVVLVVARKRRMPSDDGVAGFQRHLDALSPAARRQVIDRVKKGHD